MKHILFTITLSLFVFTILIGQDNITKKSGESISVKIEEENETEILYRKFENQNGPIYSIPKVDVLNYNRQNEPIINIEKVEYIKPTIVSPQSPALNTNEELLKSLNITDPYKQGISDAKLNYKKYKGASFGTFIPSVLFPPAGFITAIVTSATRPKEINLDFPRSDLMKIEDYKRGYTQKAKKIKQGKVWGSFGLGIATLILFGIAFGG